MRVPVWQLKGICTAHLCHSAGSFQEINTPRMCITQETGVLQSCVILDSGSAQTCTIGTPSIHSHLRKVALTLVDRARVFCSETQNNIFCYMIVCADTAGHHRTG